MKVLHITPNSNGYEVVELLANRYSRKNQLAVIKNDKGEELCTGGIILTNSNKIKSILDTIPRSEQYNWVREFRITPFVKFYFDEDF